MVKNVNSVDDECVTININSSSLPVIKMIFSKIINADLKPDIPIIIII